MKWRTRDVGWFTSYASQTNQSVAMEPFYVSQSLCQQAQMFHSLFYSGCASSMLAKLPRPMGHRYVFNSDIRVTEGCYSELMMHCTSPMSGLSAPHLNAPHAGATPYAIRYIHRLLHR